MIEFIVFSINQKCLQNKHKLEITFKFFLVNQLINQLKKERKKVITLKGINAVWI